MIQVLRAAATTLSSSHNRAGSNRHSGTLATLSSPPDEHHQLENAMLSLAKNSPQDDHDPLHGADLPSP